MEVDPWFIDAWAVHDGVAFASRCNAERRRASGALASYHTVFLTVPDLEPVPVGRITTAMRATRGSFQEGFLDFDGDEIPFASLDDVRAAVRRAYLASGLGPAGVGMPAVPPPVEPGDVGAAHFESELDELNLSSPPAYVDLSGPKLAQVLLNERPADVHRLVRAFAESVLLQWEAEAQRVRHDPERDPLRVSALVEFYVALAATAIWGSAEGLADFVHRQDAELPIGRAILNARRRSWLAQVGRRRFSNYQLLTMAPCPLRAHWSPGVRRLTDKLLLLLSVSTYLDENPQLPESAPAMLSAVLLEPQSGYIDGYTDDTTESLNLVLRAAVDWLIRQLPRVVVPHEADEYLNAYAVSRIAR